MATDYSNTGAFNVNGQWATTVRYEATIEQGAIKDVQLRFTNGRSEIASARVSADEAKDLLGEKNYGVIVKASMSTQATEKNTETQGVKGELRGKSLEFRQVTLTGYEATQAENAIALDSRVRRPDEAAARVGQGAEAVRYQIHDPFMETTYRFEKVSEAVAKAEELGALRFQAMTANDKVVQINKVNGRWTRDDGVEVRNDQERLTAPEVAASATAINVDKPTNKDAHAINATVSESTVAPATGANHSRSASASAEVNSALDEQARLRLARASAVPDAVAERFLKVEDKYYFPDKTLAFTDRGTKLKAESQNIEVIRSLVTIAESRGWESISVTGTREFRKEVWREASMRGIDVRGYEPTDIEREELRRAIEKRHGPNEISRETPQRSVDQPGQNNSRTEGAQTTAKSGMRERSPSQDQADGKGALLTGRLIESGTAPYKFDPKEKESYYVKLQTERGEKTIWGVDLQRAVMESQTKVQVGDVVAVENQGSKPVTVKAPKRDKAGNVIGQEEIDTHRNKWVVEKPAYFDERAEKAAAFRNGQQAKQELVNKYPDLTNAVVSLWLGEQFAEKKIERPEDRERVVAMVREKLTESIARGETINAPKLKQEVAQKLDAVANGFDEIAQRANAKAAERSAKAPRAKVPEEPQHVR